MKAGPMVAKAQRQKHKPGGLNSEDGRRDLKVGGDSVEWTDLQCQVGPGSSPARALGICCLPMLSTLVRPMEVGLPPPSFLKPVATGPVWRLVGLYI